MGFYSNVQILAQEKAFQKFIHAMDKYNKKHPEYRPFEPSSIKKGKISGQDVYLLEWDCIKWYDDFDEVDMINQVESELEDLKDVVGYGYKELIVNEDNTVEESWNNLELHESLYCVCETRNEIIGLEEL